LKKQARLLFQICHPRKLLKVNRVYAAIITQITNYFLATAVAVKPNDLLGHAPAPARRT